MICLNVKVSVMGPPGVIKSIHLSALLLGPLISVSVPRYTCLHRFRPRTKPPSRQIMPSTHTHITHTQSCFADKIIILKGPHSSRSKMCRDGNKASRSSISSSCFACRMEIYFLNSLPDDVIYFRILIVSLEETING